MSTRAAFRIRNKKNTFLTFTTKNGDLHQMPMIIADFIERGKFVKGINFFDDEDKLQFNGIGCFAAALIAHIKTDAGGVYIIPHSEWGNDIEDFLYDLVYEGNEVKWEVYAEAFSSARGQKHYLTFSCCNSDFLAFNLP